MRRVEIHLFSPTETLEWTEFSHASRAKLGKAVRFPLRIHKSKFTKTKMVRQLRSMRRRHGIQTSSKILLSSFFPSPAASCCPSLPLVPVAFGAGLVLCSKVSGSLALWIWLSALALCLSAFMALCCLLDLPVWFWVPGPPGCSIIPTRMFSELGLMPLLNGSNVL